jgi:hypothetical protein
VYKEQDVGFVEGRCQVPLYDAKNLVAQKSSLTAHCYVQYFLQWRFFKRLDSKKLINAKSSVLCPQWNAFCSDADAIISTIPTMYYEYRKSIHYKQHQLRFRCLEDGIACASIGHCPCCTGISDRFDHAFRAHPDYFLLSPKLQESIAMEADPLFNLDQHFDDQVGAMITTVSENAASITSMLSGLKRKAPQ